MGPDPMVGVSRADGYSGQACGLESRIGFHLCAMWNWRRIHDHLFFGCPPSAGIWSQLLIDLPWCWRDSLVCTFFIERNLLIVQFSSWFLRLPSTIYGLQNFQPVRSVLAGGPLSDYRECSSLSLGLEQHGTFSEQPGFWRRVENFQFCFKNNMVVNILPKNMVVKNYTTANTYTHSHLFVGLTHTGGVVCGPQCGCEWICVNGTTACCPDRGGPTLVSLW